MEELWYSYLFICLFFRALFNETDVAIKLYADTSQRVLQNPSFGNVVIPLAYRRVNTLFVCLTYSRHHRRQLLHCKQIHHLGPHYGKVCLITQYSHSPCFHCQKSSPNSLAMSTVLGMLIIPAHNAEFPDINFTSSARMQAVHIPASFFNQQHYQWEASELSIHLGLPLQILPFPAVRLSREYNYFARLLCIDPESTHGSFGTYARSPLHGAVIVARAADEETGVIPALDDRHLGVMISYINNIVADRSISFRQIPGARKRDKNRAHRELEMSLTPEAFAGFFELVRAKKLHEGNAVNWQNVEPPVQTEKVCCATCGKEEMEGKKSFVLCGRCKITRYCGITCRRLAWMEHKLLCFQKPKSD